MTGTKSNLTDSVPRTMGSQNGPNLNLFFHLNKESSNSLSEVELVVLLNMIPSQ